MAIWGELLADKACLAGYDGKMSMLAIDDEESPESAPITVALASHLYTVAGFT